MVFSFEANEKHLLISTSVVFLENIIWKNTCFFTRVWFKTKLCDVLNFELFVFELTNRVLVPPGPRSSWSLSGGEWRRCGKRVDH